LITKPESQSELEKLSRELAADLRALSQSPLTSDSDLVPWLDLAGTIRTKLSTTYRKLDPAIPEYLEHYFSDPDIRVKDPEYRDEQTKLVGVLISDLESGKIAEKVIQMSAVRYRVYPAVFAPSFAAICAVILACTVNAWLLLALPFIYLGSICAAPNGNLANGCLSVVAVFAGFAVYHFQKEAGMAVIGGTSLSWFLSCIEKRIRAKPEPFL